MTPVTISEPLPGTNGLEGDTAPSLSIAKSRLMKECGLTSTEARRWVVAFKRDIDNAVRIGNDTPRMSDDDFIAWVMRQLPGGRRPSVTKWQIGQGAWRTS